MNPSDLGHWTWRAREDPTEIDINDWMGFIYRITNIPEERIYYGKKQFWLQRRLKSRRGWYESDWRTYQSSSPWVVDDIRRLGDQAFHFEILSLHRTKSALRYAEANRIVRSEALLRPDQFYNRAFDGMKGKIADVSRKEDFGQRS